ncbi:LysM domain protein [Sporotomaculum syntrophicum]|uniref:LysM domain protein n=1 Tax=Sporotomaculum syntrophicum TaxID=182264 RepID=A0A9D2WN89_9FIRM|nr:LysM peptidoglycan-binding domain-containing protein [Sporotomaculum syntrophicum]KAF1084003.1 LysM domain protein [Sporotomaculum syntrophicum]
MSNDEFTRAKTPVSGEIPRPPQKCDGQLYKVKPTQTVFSIARQFGVTVKDILAANPQIVNRDIIFIGQEICIPTGEPEPVCDLRVLTLSFLTEDGQPLHIINGAVQLNARVIVRPTFNRPVSRAFFFLEPTGTETCELTSLIGVDCPSAVTGVAEILWEVPPGTLGRVFVVACINSCCAKSDEFLVVRNS